MKSVFTKAFQDWSKHDARYLAGAVTYFAVLAIPALILSILHLGKIFLMRSGNSDALFSKITEVFPADSAEFIGQFGEQSLEITGIWSGFLTLVLLAWSGSKLVDGLEKSVNNIFEVEMKPTVKGKWKITLLRTIMSFALLLLLGFMVVALFVFNALADQWLEVKWFVVLLQSVASVLLMVVLFGLLLKWLAYVKLKWSEVFMGGLVLAIVSYLGTLGINWIFGQFSLASDFAIGASIVIFLLWINYMAMILFFGLEVWRQLILRNRKVKAMDFAYLKSKPHMFVQVNGFAKLMGVMATLKTEFKIAKWYLKRKRAKAEKKSE
ncbi:hypothetical protein CVV38_01430 [Candidatus Peregrinibacteria bacterium HGW-Peregrinibacteria-1]|jgi:membrane protein|nr:MAG: hypothetical protein CVV38_01430 [Candidatus Peregrinibacteria bacterium HGW-Peregrinibacteria-1]